MEPDVSFRDLLRRARAGDPQAAAAIVREFEPKVRRAVRRPLDELRLRYLLDSADITQPVLADFFAKAADGRFELAGPDDLLALLVTMARNRVRDEARKDRAGRRDRRRVADDPDHCLSGVAGGGPTPSRLAADRDLADHTYQRLTADERYLLEQRVAGRSWADLAAEQNSTAGAVRKKLTRAVQRVAAELFPADRQGRGEGGEGQQAG